MQWPREPEATRAIGLRRVGPTTRLEARREPRREICVPKGDFLMRRWIRLLALLTIVFAMAAACGTGEEADSDDGAARDEGKDVRVAWIYIGPRNDGGWAPAHDEGRQRVEEE